MSDADPEAAVTAELQHKKRPRKQKRRAPAGEFVWVLDGKTNHPARLVVPRLESDIHGTRKSKVEICWTQTGVFQWVDESLVSYQEQGSSRQQRSRRSSLKKEEPDTTGRRKTTRQKRVLKREGTPRRTAKTAPQVGESNEEVAAAATSYVAESKETTVNKDNTNIEDTLERNKEHVAVALESDFQEEKKKNDVEVIQPNIAKPTGGDGGDAMAVEANVNVSEEKAESIHKGDTALGGPCESATIEPTKDQKRSFIQENEDSEDEPPAKKQKKKPTSRPITPPPLSPVEQESKAGVAATKTNDNTQNATPPATPSKGGKGDNPQQSTTEAVLDTISAPLSSAKRIVVSGLLELYKGLIGSSSSS